MQEDRTPWSGVLHELVQAEEVTVIPFALQLDYDYWTYRTTMPPWATRRMLSCVQMIS